MRVLAAVDSSSVADEVLAAVAHLVDADDQVYLLTVIHPSEARETYSYRGGAMQVRSTLTATHTGTVMPSHTTQVVPAECATQAAERVEAAAETRLAALASQHLPSGVPWEVKAEVDEHPADAILRVAQRYNVHGIAMGTRGRGGIAHALLGSTADAVLRRAPVPVLVVRQGLTVPRAG